MRVNISKSMPKPTCTVANTFHVWPKRDVPVVLRDFVIDEWGVQTFGTLIVGKVALVGVHGNGAPIKGWKTRLRRAWAALRHGR